MAYDEQLTERVRAVLMVRVGPEAYAASLKAWIERGRAFTATLPPKK